MPSMGEARRDFCTLLTECIWEETGNVNVALTVRSERAFNDCTGLILRRLQP